MRLSSLPCTLSASLSVLTSILFVGQVRADIVENDDYNSSGLKLNGITADVREKYMRLVNEKLYDQAGSVCPFASFGAMIVNHTSYVLLLLLSHSYTPDVVFVPYWMSIVSHWQTIDTLIERGIGLLVLLCGYLVWLLTLCTFYYISTATRSYASALTTEPATRLYMEKSQQFRHVPRCSWIRT